MKRANLIALLIFTSLCLSVNSQEFIYHRGLATLSMGVAIPAYELGTMQGIDLTGYANLGSNITGEVSYFTNWHVGMSFMITYNIYTINTDRLAEAYMLESPAFVTTSAKAEAFRDFAGLGGMVFDVPVFDRASLYFKMLGGLRSFYKPTSVVKTTTVFSNIDYYETHDNSTVVAFYFSAGGRFYINDYFNLHFNTAYMGSNLGFSYMRNEKHISEDAHIGTLMINAGVSYAF